MSVDALEEFKQFVQQFIQEEKLKMSGGSYTGAPGTVVSQLPDEFTEMFILEEQRRQHQSTMEECGYVMLSLFMSTPPLD
jgi:hypothetical protein